MTDDVTIGGTRTEHTIALTGLTPDTLYYYSVGDTGAPLAGGDSDHFFRTSPVPGTSKSTRIWVLGDSGTANSNAAAVRDAYLNFAGTDPTDLWLMLGDNAYDNGTDNEYHAAVFDMYPQVLRQVPLWPTLGNHDGASANSSTQSGPYYDIFTLPTSAEAGGLASATEAYYSFDYGNIHFICLDSHETDRSPNGAMMSWMEFDLAATDKEWIIAFWHHPPYSKGSHDSDSESQLIEMRQSALPILEDYGVDLVMTGHSHSHERSFLIDAHYGDSESLTEEMQIDGGDGREDGNGVYAKTGGAGAPHRGAVYAVAGSSGKISGGPLDHDAMFVSLNTLGSMVLDIDANRLDAIFLAADGDVDDYFTITKGPDLTAPGLAGAWAETATAVRVEFSEGVDEATAINPGNYAIDTATIVGAVLQSDGRTVSLTTSPLVQGATNLLTVNGVLDRAGNEIAPGTQLSFVYLAIVSMSFQNGTAPDATYSGTRDTYLSESSKNSNFGSSTVLFADGDDGGGDDLSTLLAWDLTGIPDGATVQAASITLDVFNPSGGTYSLFEIKRPWVEGEATWNEYASGSDWQSSGAFGTNDRGSQSLGAVTAGSIGSITTVLNTAGVSLVQGWIDGSTPNNGVVLGDNDTSDGINFDSGEVANAASRPRFTLTLALAPDLDNDGLPDDADNCVVLPNADQRDTNGDGYGNVCDPDLDDNGIVNFGDLAGFKAVFLMADEDADFDGNGTVDFGDLAVLKQFFLAPPGPSGTVP